MTMEPDPSLKTSLSSRDFLCPASTGGELPFQRTGERRKIQGRCGKERWETQPFSAPGLAGSDAGHGPVAELMSKGSVFFRATATDET